MTPFHVRRRIRQAIGRLLGNQASAQNTSSAPREEDAPPPPTDRPVDRVAELLGQVKSEDFEQRVEAIRELSAHRGEQVLEAITAGLRDAAAEVGEAAARALARQPQGREALEVAIENADGWLAPSTRAAALSALAQHGGDEVLELLLEKVSDPAVEVSATAIEALGNTGSSQATHRLWDVVRNEQGYYLADARGAALRSLAHLGEDRGELESAARDDAELDPSVLDAP